MKHICELQKILNEYFNWNKSRMTVLVNLLLGLFINRTVNLKEHATTLSSCAQIDSNYKRLQRFFNWIILNKDYQVLARKLVISVFNLKYRKNELALDRTDWKFGKKHINILVLTVNIKGVGVPLAWISLGRAGNSKTKDRISILNEILHEIPIKSFTADREFIGEEWFKFLIHLKVPFFIRIKEDTQVVRKNGSYTIALRNLFQDLKTGQKRYLKGHYSLLGVEIALAASRNYKKELLIVVTNQSPLKALKIYKRRWVIETLFCYLKTKGFGFENTHMTDPKKIEAWMFMFTIAVAWTLKTNKVVRLQPSFAKHGRKRKSLFKSCFELIRRYLSNLDLFMEGLIEYIYLLAKPKMALEGV